MINYHSFTEEGHWCPTCEEGPFPCTMEDGQCENQGTCDSCIKAQVRNQRETMHPLDIAEMEYRQEMQERGF